MLDEKSCFMDAAISERVRNRVQPRKGAAQVSPGRESWVQVRTDFTSRRAQRPHGTKLFFLKEPGRSPAALLPFIGLLILDEFATTK